MSGVDSVIEGPKKLHDLGQKLAGGQYVALFLWVGGVVLLHGGFIESVELIVPVITITTVLYRLGGSLDDLLFDPLFQPETDTNPLLRWFGRDMRQVRRNAAYFMLTGERQYAPPDGEEQNEEPRTEGIYSRSEMLYRGTPVWNKRVEPNLRLSKAVRCLVIPSSLVFIYDFWPSFLPRWVPTGELFKPFGFLGTAVAQWVCLSLCLIFISLYLALRLRHMRTLYSLVTEMAVFRSSAVNFGNTHRQEEQLSSKGCIFFIDGHQIRQILRNEEAAKRYSALLISIFSSATRPAGHQSEGSASTGI